MSETPTCPGLSMPDDEWVACYRAGHVCPPYAKTTTTTNGMVMQSWSCPCCGQRGSSVCMPVEWETDSFEVPVNLRAGLVLDGAE